MVEMQPQDRATLWSVQSPILPSIDELSQPTGSLMNKRTKRAKEKPLFENICRICRNMLLNLFIGCLVADIVDVFVEKSLTFGASPQESIWTRVEKNNKEGEEINLPLSKEF